MRLLSHQEVINIITEVHGNTYDLSKVQYLNRRTKIELICKSHGSFMTQLDQIKRGQGCPVCGRSGAGKKRRVTYEDFLKMAHKAHGDKYEYDPHSYHKIIDTIKIKCQDHGWFEQRADAHVRQSQGCPECGRLSQISKRVLTLSEFIERSNITHENKYDYSNSKYVNNSTKIEVLCPKHGAFFPSPDNHLNGSGCPDCFSSKGEDAVRQILTRLKIQFSQQHRFEELYDKGHLKCDFYLPDYNSVIEFNGRQHYEPVTAWGGELGLKEVQRRDQIKRDYFKSEGIKLLEIHFLENEIEKTILSFLGI